MEKIASCEVETLPSVATNPVTSPSDNACSTDPAWYTPARLLVAFCVVSFLVFLDRGIIASNGVNGDKEARTGIQGEFQLSKFQDGVLPAAFMVGLLVASLLFSELCKHYNAFRLIGWGMAIFTVSSVGCGFANSFWTLLACRIVMGAGEASIINLTGPFIDDVAPPDQKTLWFGILYLFPTVGIAGGYIFGGVVGASMGWRMPFFIQAGVCVPVVVWLFMVHPISLRTMHDEEDETHSDLTAPLLVSEPAAPTGVAQSLWGDICILCKQPTFLFNALGACPLQGAFGVYSYFGPQAAHELFGVGRESIDLTFGGVTIITAVVATLLGGWVLDRVGSSIKNAMLMNGWSAIVGFIAIVVAFWLPPATSTGFVWFMAVFAVGELAIFAGTAPSGAVTVWSVPTRLRPLASGIAAIASHILGDVPTPPLVGLMQGYVQDWRVSMLVLTFILIAGAVLFFFGAYVRCTDYRPEEERLSLEKGHRLTATNAGNVGPLVSDIETATLIHNHGDIADTSHA
ncbi:hypothetical protein ABBQ32_007873 [Trebouxia sp. C0010 RCD-2024]